LHDELDRVGLELLSELPAIRRHLCLSFLPGNDRLQEVSHPILYFLAGIGCYGAVRLGHTEWFYLGMLTCWWTALKLTVHGLAATVRLLIARGHENLAVRTAIRNERRTALSEGRTAPTHTAAERRRITRNVRHTLFTQYEIRANSPFDSE
ncbi:hypothetical protein, partial [Microbacterium petrolearium]